MNVQKRNDVSVYCLSSGPTLPEWLGDRAKRNLSKRDENIRRRIELIQEFQMPASSSRLIQSPNGRYIFAAGTYPPRIRCYDVHELSMKFERYTDAGVLDMVMLGEDYGKIALLRDDRTIAFHAPYGAHESIRIPTFGRAMAYEQSTCEILLPASGDKIYRINLDEGRFSEPWEINTDGVSANCITVSEAHPLAALGCDDGAVRFWDNRSPDTLLKPFLKLDVQRATNGYGYQQETAFTRNNPKEITSIALDPSGMFLAVGTGNGLAALYDVRSSRPLHIKEHKHGVPVHTIRFHSGSGMIWSADEHLLKCWRYKTEDTLNVSSTTTSGGIDKEDTLGSVKVNIEGTGKFQHFLIAGDESDPSGSTSGLVMCATDSPKIESYFVPAVGVAPKWCSFLENITEELEERDLNRDGAGTEFVRDGQETIYENYKFVTRDDLESLGVSNLVGTPMLRGYMHGYFMDINLYNRVKAVANPFEYADYQKKKLKERLEAKRSSRIAQKPSQKADVAVNAKLAKRLAEKALSSTKAGKTAKSVLVDDRFGRLFDNPDFDINEEDEEFKLRNPSGVAESKSRKENIDSESEDEEDDVVEQPVVEASSEEDSMASDSDDDDDGFAGGKVRGEAYEMMKKVSQEGSVISPATKPRKKARLAKAEQVDEKGATSLGLGDPAAQAKAARVVKEMNMPLAKRAALRQEEDEIHRPEVRGGKGGNKEVSFIPRDRQKTDSSESKGEGRKRGGRRRGIKELGLKNPARKRY